MLHMTSGLVVAVAATYKIAAATLSLFSMLIF